MSSQLDALSLGFRKRFLSYAELERQLVAAMAQEAAQRPTSPEAPAATSAQEQAMIDLVMERQAQGLSLDGLDLSGLGGD